MDGTLGLHIADYSLLEIGALTPNNYAKCKWIDNSPIDLNSQHPAIVQQDFFDRPLPKTDAERFDIISCSLVLNFVPEPGDRGMCSAITELQTSY